MTPDAPHRASGRQQKGPTPRASTVRIPPPHHHRDVSGGPLRAGVFGAMDGLVSNFSLVAGVLGGGVSSHTALVTGLAGLAAGAFSMAVGEYTSVTSQTEATEAEIAKEKTEIARNLEGETAELAQVYTGYGVDPALAEQVAAQITRHPDASWRVHAREELGVDPDALPSAFVAAGSSFLCFALGALIPLIPLLLGTHSVLVVALVCAVALAGSGAVVARLTRRSVWFSAARQLLLGLAAAAATYGIGHLVGASLS